MGTNFWREVVVEETDIAENDFDDARVPNKDKEYENLAAQPICYVPVKR